MSQPTMPAEAVRGRMAGSLPAALRIGAREHVCTRLVFHGAASTAEVGVEQVHRRASSVAAGLGALGVGRGEVVAVQLPYRVEAAIAYAAVLLRGAVLLPIDPSMGARDVHRVLRHSRAAALVTSAWRSHDVLRARGSGPGIPRLRHVVAVTGTWPTAAVPADGVDWEMLERFRPVPPEGMTRPDDVSLVAYSPAGGAVPLRAARHTHASLLAELAAMPPVPGYTPCHVHLASPASDGLVGATTLLRALVTGLPTVFLERWGAQAAVDLVHRHRVTSAALSAHHLWGLLDAGARDGRGLAELTDCLVLRSVPVGIVEAAERAGVLAYGGYGRAEHPTIVAGSSRDPFRWRASGAGRPLPGNEVRIVDAEGRELPVGEEGHILSRGPELFAGYLDQTDVSLTPDGWFPTGDRGALDEDGFLRVSRADRAGTGAGRLVAPGSR
ncbi:AMP-binding protein [Streptomyces sp. SID4956]|uniref:AMP-binding protein n=1 Tax=Streptomyces sp. SID4956 TaxID=2690290 RepID=UPI001369D300|nr:AMP-binding protein [Streptomyces sp. SID4956]